MLAGSMDHTPLVSGHDAELRKAYDSKKWSYLPLPFESTAENLCLYFCPLLTGEHGSYLMSRNITHAGVTIFETRTYKTSFRVKLNTA